MQPPNAVPTTWRDQFPPHALAEIYPMLSDLELDALAKDIAANGLQEPIVLLVDGDRRWLLDGRNRAEALTRLGRDLADHVVEAPAETDPATFVISANVRRRHLTKQQQADLILATIEAARKDSATTARSFSPIAGTRGGSTPDPVLAAAVAVATTQGISRRTVEIARARRRGKPKSLGTVTSKVTRINVPIVQTRKTASRRNPPADRTRRTLRVEPVGADGPDVLGFHHRLIDLVEQFCRAHARTLARFELQQLQRLASDIRRLRVSTTKRRHT